MCTRQNSQRELRYKLFTLYKLLLANNIEIFIYLYIYHYEIYIKTKEEALRSSNGDTGLGRFGYCASSNE